MLLVPRYILGVSWIARLEQDVEPLSDIDDNNIIIGFDVTK